MTRPAIPARRVPAMSHPPMIAYTAICDRCGAAFERKRLWSKHPVRFCSTPPRLRGKYAETQHKAARLSAISRGSRAAKKAPDTRRCINCSVLFTPRERHNQMHCSTLCVNVRRHLLADLRGTA